MYRRNFLKLACASGAISILPAVRRAAAAQAGPFIDGEMYALECLGNEHTAFKFLDGRTGDGSVALAPTTNPPFSGTKWRASVRAGNFVLLECQGTIEGPRVLDGHTADHSVHLALSATGGFSGTLWQVVAPNDATTNLKCMGNDNPNLFLDGVTHDGTVRLSNSTAPPFTGTRWRVIPFGTI
jgi:hypothetical protein